MQSAALTNVVGPQVGAPTGSELAAFERDGFFVREGLFSDSELTTLRDAIEEIHGNMSEKSAREDDYPIQMVDDKRYQEIDDSVVKWEWQDESRDIRSMEPFLHLHPNLSSLIDDPRLWMPAKAMLGYDGLSLFTDKLNFKRPGGSPFPFHQDSPYFALECKHVEELVSMQIYMDDARVENGCLWMVPGSHKLGILPGVQGKGILDRLYTDMEAHAELEPVAVEVPAGSVIFFHAHVIHGSKGNKTDESRRAMVVTYQPPGHNCWRRDDAREIRM